MRVYLPLVAGALAATIAGFCAGLLGVDPITCAAVAVFLGGITAYIVGMLAGNKRIATVSPASLGTLARRAASGDRSLVYVYREGFIGRLLGIDVRCDGRAVGQLKTPQFLCFETDAGAHTLGVAAGGAFAAAQNAATDIALDAEAGSLAVFRIRIAMGLLKNTIAIERDPDIEGAFAKMARFAMVTVVAEPA